MGSNLKKQKTEQSNLETRKNRDYFMAVALLSAKRSKDPSTQVGACIVNEKNVIVGVGYNGMPRGCSDDEFPWGRGKERPDHNSKYVYVCHAEMNAIMNKNVVQLDGCTIYVTLFPCNDCAQLIIQAGIKQVFFLRYHENGGENERCSKEMLTAAGIKFEKFNSNDKKEIVLVYSSSIIKDTPQESQNDQNGNLIKPLVDTSKKRENSLSWEDYLMGIALLSAQRSSDPYTPEGACIVNEENVIVGVGYKSKPRGCSDDNIFPWSQNYYVCHAEMNAIMNKNVVGLKNCTIYATCFPCNKCAQLIIQAGIKKVIFLSDKEIIGEENPTKRMFDSSDIDYKRFDNKDKDGKYKKFRLIFNNYKLKINK